MPDFRTFALLGIAVLCLVSMVAPFRCAAGVAALGNRAGENMSVCWAPCPDPERGFAQLPSMELTVSTFVPHFPNYLVAVRQVAMDDR